MKVGVIGGSLLKQLHCLDNVTEEVVKTPFGIASDKFIRGDVHGREVVFINRHGYEHHIAPHQVNYRANMFALKLLDVTHVLSVAAVGGISENMSPMTWVIPDQIIDYTHGRIQTFNDGNQTEVNHIDFTYPYDAEISLSLIDVLSHESVEFEPKATYGVTQGPRLETMAEINRMHNDGCDIVGMTAMPEAALARELELKYASIALVVNWAAGKGGSDETISMDDIKQRINEGNQSAEKIVSRFIQNF